MCCQGHFGYHSVMEERNNKWLTSSGKSPTNLNLFHRLNDTVTSMENDGIDVGFWHIDRKYNLADFYAKEAAKLGQQA